MPYLFLGITLAGIVATQLLLRKGLFSVGQLPQGLNEIGPFFIKAFTNLYVLGAVFTILIAGLSWISAVSRAGEISRIYPLMALSYILVVLFSTVFFNEEVTYLRWIGVILIGAGVFMVARS